MKTSSAKAKGRRLQQRVAADIVATFGFHPDDATSRSSGATGTDVLLSGAAAARFPYAVECKNQERVALWEAWRQAEANAGDDRAPLLVLARNRQEPLAVLTWEDFLWLAQKARG